MNPLAWSFVRTLASGVVVNYWVPVSMSVNMMTAKAQVVYNGYLDADTYNAGKDPLTSESVTIDFSSFDPTGQIAAGVMKLVQVAQAGA